MIIKHSIWISLILLFTIVLASAGCQKEELNTDSSFTLEFSTDTVIFDTVFTTIGSSTRSLVIRNTSESRINISRISLARGKASPFRLNIDGAPAEEYSDLEIAANDSAYIFVKVTIDPNNINTPLIESDSIVFETNGNIQDVKLVAWGQDAYFHLDTIFKGEVTLPDNKPHVVYGKLIAGEGCKMTVTAGTKLYFHFGSSFEIRSGASLIVSGTLEKPVTFSGDRLEDYYLDKTGMWEGIWLEKGCSNISFTYAEITNAKVGIQADSIGYSDNEPLRLHNCLIHNMLNYCLIATTSKIVATNCQLTNSGGNVLLIDNGGDYDFRNCTIARYFNGKGYPCLSISNFTTDTLFNEFPTNLENAYFGNCIITGSQQGEIELRKNNGASFNFLFEYCLVQCNDDTLEKYKDSFINCVINKSAEFVDPYTNNFQLDTLSFAVDSASLSVINGVTPSIILDRKGVSRLDHGQPDIGSYERVEKR